MQITEERANVKPYISYIYKYDDQDNVIEEKWVKEPNGEYSRKSHKYDAKGLLLETDSYSATYNFSVLVKYNYDFFQ